MKKLLISLMILIAVFFMAPVGNTVEKSEVQSLVEYIMSPNAKIFKTDTRTIMSAENKCKHNLFLWKYTYHFVTLFAGVVVNTKEYNENISSDESRSMVVWHMVDSNFDGEIDDWSREFLLVAKNGIIIMPTYPNEFIDKNWHIPPKEAAQKKFDEEIKYWNKIKGHEQWEIKIQER